MDNKKKEEAASAEKAEATEKTTEETAKEKNVKPKSPKTSEKMKELEEKLQEQSEKYMRLYAEYDNFRKRTGREMDARYGDAVIDTVEKILPIGDSIKRALETEVTSDDAVEFKKGIEMVMKQFDDALEKAGVEEIESEGGQFDPNIHNAVMHVDDENIDENTVVEEFMKGYKYKDGRVIRHSMVKVAN